MFASLKSKIKEETGSDLSKLTSSWRSGSFLGKISLRDESSTTASTSTSGQDSATDTLSPQLETYLAGRTGGQIDQASLQHQYTAQLEAKIQERDAYWEDKMKQLRSSLASVQGEEAKSAQAIARSAQAEAAKAVSERDVLHKQLEEMRVRLAAVENAQDRLDAVTEELEESRRQWSRDRSELSASLSAAEAKVKDLTDELALLRAAMPPSSEFHFLNDDDKREVHTSGCADYDKLLRERAVLSRQLQEAKVALADVKTSWSGQIASLETQVARLSRQAGEEGAERRRSDKDKRELQEKMVDLTAELEKTRQSLANSEAKVVRLNGEVHALAMEVKALRSNADHQGDKAMDLERQLELVSSENKELKLALENERALVKILQEKVDLSTRLYDEKSVDLNMLNTMITEMQHDCVDLQNALHREKREKDEALLRNAQMSQTLEMSQNNVRYQEAESNELQARVGDLERALASHKENQANCLLIKEAEVARKIEIEQLKRRIEELSESEIKLRSTIEELEADICDKNKRIKTLDNRIADMKKTLQRELQTTKSDLTTTADEQDISRRYLKHVVLRFVTSREIEARQLTRALSVLLRLSAHEEAMLRSSLSPRTGISAWFPSLNT